MAKVFDTLLLLALPASGKSEVRRFLKSLPSEECEKDFHIGGTVQLDDFPYVHLMQRIDEILLSYGETRLFFEDGDKSFSDPFCWGTLIQLINEDYDELVMRNVAEPEYPGMDLLNRLEHATHLAGGLGKIVSLSDQTRTRLAKEIDPAARELLETKRKNLADTLEGKTVVIEFARGGPDGSPMPIEQPQGYLYSLGQLSDQLLATAAILYIWVTPEESRRKNSDRADPNDPGSILNHGVPMYVMMNDYGCDDIDYLLEQSPTPDTVSLRVRGQDYTIPLAKFDNREDLTSFLRADQSDWREEDVAAIHKGLKEACQKLAANYS